MKNYIKVVSSFLIVLILMLPLASCAEKPLEDLSGSALAFEVLERAGKKMDTLDSYTIESESIVRASYQNKAFVISVNGINQYTGLKTGELKIKNEIKTTTAYEYSSKTDTVIDGFQSGNMYYYDSGGAKLYSKISANDYIKHYGRAESPILSFDKSDCNKATVKNENGYYIATFLDFDEDYLKLIQSTFSNSFTEILGNVTGYCVTLQTHPDLFFDTVSITITFENDIEFNVDTSFSQFDGTEVNEMELANYTKVDDIRLLDYIDDKFNSLNPDDKFKLETVHSIKHNSVTNEYKVNIKGECLIENLGAYLPQYYSESKITDIKKGTLGFVYTVELNTDKLTVAPMQSVLPVDFELSGEIDNLKIDFYVLNGELLGYKCTAKLHIPKNDELKGLSYSVITTCYYN